MAEADPPEKAPAKPPLRARKHAELLSGLVEKSLAETLRAKGFADSSVHSHWAEIAGAGLAPWSEPVSLRWPQRGPGSDPDRAREGAVLTVKVESAFALEMQHMTPQIVERVNRFIGWRCVEKLALKQGPVRKGERPEPRRKPVLTAEASRRLDAMLEPVESGALKAALQRLGVAVLGTK
ncbi:MAG: DUF721 domain-containing protein [Beijerinckiaceae bacterium]